ncbi:thiamine pyrophosphate-binding protein [Pseudolysinimonas kribbensis]|uniref:Acetolactate synthase I/II/III large subunit n=1 Tax=Pseudolysinimonas kribbensis TaxID=433641 RepID=A0ABQ6K945_9MICO|nr:thiamine pyrophosphate-binding protein [Pseudolysinimonas kribbensis]GMA95357.1 acetolactate synthase I/II/III large subunit [Pseudolysinimonas kribbensis]
MSGSSSTVSSAVARAIAARADDVFGVMGNGNAHVLDALTRTTARFTAVRHEAGGVVAADAYARASGRIAVATTTYGPGFANALTPLAEAAHARIPLVLLTGAAPTTGPRGWDLDQHALALALGVPTVTVDAATPQRRALEAFDRAVRERIPVVLAIPYDLATATAGDEEPVPPDAPLAPPPLDEAANAGLRRAAAVLAAAERPHLLAGRGAWLAGAGAELNRLAAALGATTSSTALGRGLFADAAHDLGVTGGFGDPAAMDAIHDADAVLVVGASLSPFTTRFGRLFGPAAHVIRIDLADASSDERVDVHIRADARVAAEALTELVRAGSPDARVVPRHPEADPEPDPEHAADGRLHPRALAERLATLLPEDRIVVTDGGHFIGWPNTAWPVASPERMIMVGTAIQTIGVGFPSLVGATRARPDTTIVLAAGDGGSLMALADLETAVRVAGGRGMAVVFNDAAYGAEVHAYADRGVAEAATRIPEADFAALATASGAHGVVVRDLADLEPLRTWTSMPPAERPFLLLDCRISPLVVAPFWHEVVAQGAGQSTGAPVRGAKNAASSSVASSGSTADTY